MWIFHALSHWQTWPLQCLGVERFFCICTNHCQNLLHVDEAIEIKTKQSSVRLLEAENEMHALSLFWAIRILTNGCSAPGFFPLGSWVTSLCFLQQCCWELFHTPWYCLYFLASLESSPPPRNHTIGLSTPSAC